LGVHPGRRTWEGGVTRMWAYLGRVHRRGAYLGKGAYLGRGRTREGGVLGGAFLGRGRTQEGGVPGKGALPGLGVPAKGTPTPPPLLCHSIYIGRGYGFLLIYSVNSVPVLQEDVKFDLSFGYIRRSSKVFS
jgi:hypothetical protein